MNDDDDNIRPYVRKQGKPRKPTHNALRQALEANGFTNGIVAMNTFARRPMLMKPIPVAGRTLDPEFKPRPLRDSDITGLALVLEIEGFVTVRASMIRDVVIWLADHNAFSPPARLIESLVWDGTPRLSTFFIDYAGVIAQDDRHRAYVEAVTRCFFISIVARVMEPGCKVDTMLMLEGPQGSRKSSLLRMIALSDEWFSDSMPHDLASLDARQHLPGKMIIEMPEVAQLKRSGLEAMKAFLSCQHDKYRPSFGRFDIDWPRQNVFVGTTNADDYLRDPTGNRRFWPLTTTTIDVIGAGDVIEQIYAEARAAYECDEEWWLPDEIEETARAEQADRMEEEPWFDEVADFVETRDIEDGFKWATVPAALNHVGIPKEARTKGHEMRISAIFKRLGGERKSRTMKQPQGEMLEGKKDKRQWQYRFVPT